MPPTQHHGELWVSCHRCWDRGGACTGAAFATALAGAHRWRRLLESGVCGSMTELAAAEKIDRSFLCRVLRPTLVAPEIVEAIMDGWQPEEVTLPALMKGGGVGGAASVADQLS